MAPNLLIHHKNVKKTVYITDIQNFIVRFRLNKYEKKFGTVVGIIEIPEGVPIVNIGDKYKSPEINIIELFDYDEFLNREYLYIEEKKKITDSEFIFKKMPYLQTFDIYMEAVKQNHCNLKFVKPELQTVVSET